MNRYKVIIYWSDEDDAFIAEMPELPGCAADGATRKEALDNLEVVAQEWIEADRERRRSAVPYMTANDLLNSGLVGLWKDRDDIGDSVEFARKLREEAQNRQFRDDTENGAN